MCGVVCVCDMCECARVGRWWVGVVAVVGGDS